MYKNKTKQENATLSTQIERYLFIQIRPSIPMQKIIKQRTHSSKQGFQSEKKIKKILRDVFHFHLLITNIFMRKLWNNFFILVEIKVEVATRLRVQGDLCPLKIQTLKHRVVILTLCNNFIEIIHNYFLLAKL